MSVYSYTVNVDISVAAKDVSVDPLNIEEGSRDVKSVTADVSLSVVSYTADVDTNSEWLASVDRNTLTLPTDQCRFLFDVSNPNCYPGAGGTLFDLSGNERNCEIRQLSTNADATGVTSNGPADDSGTLLDSFEASSDSIGSYVSLNKDKTVNTKYLRWQAPSDVPSSFTAFMVSAGANVADYAEEDDIDVDLNDAILGKTDNLWFSSRAGGGYAHRNLYTSNRGRTNYGSFTDGVPNPQYAYFFAYRAIHTLYTIRDYQIYSQARYILEDASYTDKFVARYPTIQSDLFSSFPEPGGVGNNIQRTSMAPAGPDVFSVTYEGNKARTYVNGKFVGERDVSSSRVDSTSGTWLTGVANNNDSTIRANSVQSGDIYAWGFYDRTFTEEEHLNIHKKFAQDVSPSKSVDLLNYPSYVQFNIADDIGKPDVTVDIPWNQEAIVNYDVNVDVSVQSSEVSLEEILPFTPGLLNITDQAEVAYSLRKLSFLHAGAAIRVRREDNDNERDIGFANNELDVTSLASFCEGTNGFVTTWYDQSGNFNNATQTSLTRQARIYNSSTGVTTDNKGNPTIIFNLTQSSQSYSFDSEVVLRNANPDRFLISFVADVSDEDSDVGYTTNPNNNSGEYFAGTSFAQFNFFSYEGNSSRYRFRHTNETSTSPGENVNTNYALPDPFFTHDTIASFALYVDSEVKKLNVNGQNLSSSGASGWVSGGERRSNIGRIGRGYSVDLNAGMYSEFIIWRNYSDGDLEKVQGNVNDHYSIY